MLEADIDYIVLGCSHFPYLIPHLKKILPSNIKIIDSGEAVAKQTQNILNQNNLMRIEKSLPSLQFFSNDNTSTLKMLLKDFLNNISIKKINF